MDDSRFLLSAAGKGGEPEEQDLVRERAEILIDLGVARELGTPAGAWPKEGFPGHVATRRTVEPDAAAQRHLRTDAGVGYRFVGAHP